MRTVSARMAAFAAVLAVAAGAAVTEARAQHSRRSPIVEAVQKTRPSIVSIKIVRTRGHSSRTEVAGTGIIIDESGTIVTNRHVVGSQRSVTVCLSDGGELSGDVLMADSNYDLAVVKVEARRKLPALALAPVSDLMVGETVIAVGHPFGYTNTVSTGIISALGREITMPTGEVLSGLIQTDASINPGNSGGPLLNINGELIGVNVALRDGAQGIAFAINAGTVKQVLRRYFSAQRVAGVTHGLLCQEKVLGETGDRQRVVVAGVAEQVAATVKNGDEILAVAQRPVQNSFDVERALWDRRPGEQVTIKLLRQGHEVTVTLTLQSGQGNGQIATAPQSPASQRPTPVRTSGVANRP